MRDTVLALLEELVARLEIVEEQPFRVKAYQRLLEHLTRMPREAWSSPETVLQALEGKDKIGDKLKQTLHQLLTKGSTPLLDELRKKVPDSLLELRRLPGLGPRRIQQLWKEVGVVSVDSLQQALQRGKLHKLSGWGPLLIQRLEEAIRIYQKQRHLLLYAEALAIWEQVSAALRQKGILAEPVGQLRRALPLIEGIEGILLAENAPLLIEEGWLLEKEDLVLQHPELPVRLYGVEEWGEALLRLTGPPTFWEKIRPRLPEKRKGLTEEELFRAAGLPYILPAWRDWEDILELAEKGHLPEPLQPEHIQGTLHVHTTYSDGADSLEAMAEAARGYGWKWLGIADHSQRAYYAGGLSPTQLAEQGEAIDHLNRTYAGTFYLLKGIEADILPSGEIDYTEEVWRKLDFIVASVHEKLHMEREEATQRLSRALSNPYVKVLGHWTGRLLRSRPGYPIEEETILEICAQQHIAIEFNANPYRMEIDWRWVRRAAELHVPIILTTDAHAVEELAYWRLGLSVLQKGLLPPHLLLNTYSEPPFRIGN